MKTQDGSRVRVTDERHLGQLGTQISHDVKPEGLASPYVKVILDATQETIYVGLDGVEPLGETRPQPNPKCCLAMREFADHHVLSGQAVYVGANYSRKNRRDWAFCPWCGKPLPITELSVLPTLQKEQPDEQ
jgi:hypothetical protein